MSPSSITKEQHTEFYRFISNAWDEPRFVIQMATDAPLHVRALLYVPTVQREKFGLEQLQPGVSLYTKRVLIKAQMEGLLPSYLRFVRGVVDSEDIPLNVSRELLQVLLLPPLSYSRSRTLPSLLGCELFSHPRLSNTLKKQQRTVPRSIWTFTITILDSFARECTPILPTWSALCCLP